MIKGVVASGKHRSSGGAIALGTFAHAGSSSAGAITTTAITTQATGSTFVICGCTDFTSARAGTPTDSKGNTYVQVGTAVYNATDGFTLSTFVCINGVGGSGHTFSYSATFGSYTVIFAVEVLNALGTDGYATGTTGAVTGPYLSGNITTTNADDMLLGFVLFDTSTPPQACTADSPMTLIASHNATSNNDGIGASYQIVSSTVTQAASFEASPHGEYACTAILALKGA